MIRRPGTNQLTRSRHGLIVISPDAHRSQDCEWWGDIFLTTSCGCLVCQRSSTRWNSPANYNLNMLAFQRTTKALTHSEVPRLIPSLNDDHSFDYWWVCWGSSPVSTEMYAKRWQLVLYVSQFGLLWHSLDDLDKHEEQSGLPLSALVFLLETRDITED